MSTPTGTPGNQARGADSTLADGRPTPEHPGGHRDGTAVRHDDPTLVRRDDEPTLARPEYAAGPDTRTDDGAGALAPHATATELGLDRQAVVQREKEAFGGLKIGSAFFGWLAATGMAVILTALLAGAGTAVGVATNTDPAQAVDAATGNVATVGWGGAIALAVIVFVAFYCGGYVAGRMARFNGAKQGVAVWLWTVVVSLVVAGVGAALGSQYDVLGRLDAFPRIPVGEGDVTTAGLLSLLVAVVVALVGAVVGGLAGMRFHRKVDKAGLGR